MTAGDRLKKNDIFCISSGSGLNMFVMLLLIIFIPPLAAFCFRKYKCDVDVLVCLVLSFFFVLPGVIYAAVVVLHGPILDKSE